MDEFEDLLGGTTGSSSESGKKPLILIVDDEENYQKLLEFNLKTAGTTSSPPRTARRVSIGPAPHSPISSFSMAFCPGFTASRSARPSRARRPPRTSPSSS
jgi:hypothetical protein